MTSSIYVNYGTTKFWILSRLYELHSFTTNCCKDITREEIYIPLTYFKDFTKFYLTAIRYIRFSTNKREKLVLASRLRYSFKWVKSSFFFILRLAYFMQRRKAQFVIIWTKIIDHKLFSKLMSGRNFFRESFQISLSRLIILHAILQFKT